MGPFKFFDLETARRKLKPGQVELIDELEMISNRKSASFEK
jgi:hypothetical protein